LREAYTYSPFAAYDVCKKQIIKYNNPKTHIQFDNVIRAAFFGLDQSDLSVTKKIFYTEKSSDNNRRMIQH